MTVLQHISAIWILGNMAIFALLLCAFRDPTHTRPLRATGADVQRSDNS